MGVGGGLCLKMTELSAFTPLILNYSFHLPLTTRSSSFQSFPLSFLTPHLCLAGLIHLCSLLSIAKTLTHGFLQWQPHLHFADWRITMKDKVIIISIHFSL